MIPLTLFFVGFVFIIKGADLLVTGASAIAARFNIPDIVVGLTIVSFGTSMPELSVSVLASLAGHTDLAIGNVLGSNIANILLVLGIAAMVAPLPVRSSTVLSEIPFSLTAALLVGFLANASLFSTKMELTISRLDGVFLLLFLVLFIAYVFKITKDGHVTEFGTETPIGPAAHSVGLPRSIAYVLLGVVGLYLGGDWIVAGALDIAALLGFSESLIALTIVALGTSLPELVTSAVAAYRGNPDVAVGNVVGSNIVNLLWVLGVSAVITELPFDHISNTDIVMVVFSSTMLIFSLAVGRRGVIDRWKGIVFVLIYIAYFAYLIQRG